MGVAGAAISSVISQYVSIDFSSAFLLLLTLQDGAKAFSSDSQVHCDHCNDYVSQQKSYTASSKDGFTKVWRLPKIWYVGNSLSLVGFMDVICLLYGFMDL